jgi:hypothetical protein
MLFHGQNSYAPRSKRFTGVSEAQSRGTGKQNKNPPSITLIGNPEEKRPHGIPSGRWEEDNKKINTEVRHGVVDWIIVAQDRAQ